MSVLFFIYSSPEKNQQCNVMCDLWCSMRCNLCVQERGNRKRHSEVEDADTEHRQVCRCVYVMCHVYTTLSSSSGVSLCLCRVYTTPSSSSGVSLCLCRVYTTLLSLYYHSSYAAVRAQFYRSHTIECWFIICHRRSTPMMSIG